MHPAEHWRPISDWPGYEVSDQGRVRSFWHRIGWRALAIARDRQPRILKGSFGEGYPKVRLSNPREGRHTYTYVHLLVLKTFVGPCPEGMEACHEDGDRSRAHLSNLRWDTPVANQADKIKHGTYVAGSLHHHAKLSDDQIGSIFALSASGVSQSTIAKRFGVNQSTVCRIVTRQRYREHEGETVLRMLDRKDARQAELFGDAA